MSEHGTRQRSRTHRAQDTWGMRGMFWAWTTIIFAGLLVMIITPLTGR